MFSYKENMPLAFNNFIIKPFSLKLYKEAYWLINNELFIILLNT
jgi:hypothetical protein